MNKICGVCKKENDSIKFKTCVKCHEREKAYYLKNIEKEHIRSMKYRTQNKEKIRDKQKNYYTNNIDKLESYHDCSCGRQYQYRSKARHLSSNYHKKHSQINTLNI